MPSSCVKRHFLSGAIGMLGLFGLAQAAPAAVILIDFGPNDTTNGRNTVSPTNGKTYNNVNTPTTNTPSSPLLDTTGAATTVTVTPLAGTTAGGATLAWQTNGRLNGGLASPTSPPLAADFAVGTLTEDYFYFDAGGINGNATLRFGGLDPTQTYTLDIFATRTAADSRTTRYTVGTQTIDLQTTGTGSGSAANPTGNDDTLATFTNLVPNAGNQLTLGVTSAVGNFGYVGGIRLTAVPEPTSLAALSLGGLMLLRRRRHA